MYAKSWQAAHDGAGLLANKLIEAEFPVRTLIQLHQVQMGESRGKWKVEAWLDLISPPGVVVRLK